jgi:TetR/AcrR family transcriptional regulator
MGIAERRKRERDLRRELVMDAAMAIYNEEGYHAITMEKIAERCEISRASLYLYFRNKEEMLISAIVNHTEYFTDLLQDLYDNREKVKAKLLEELWGRFIDFYEKEPETFNASLYFLQREMILNLPEELKDCIDKSGRNVVSLQHKIIEYGVKEGLFIECDPMTLAEVVWTSFLGIIQLERSKQVLGHKGHLEKTRELALKVLARGIVKK